MCHGEGEVVNTLLISKADTIGAFAVITFLNFLVHFICLWKWKKFFYESIK